MKLRDQIDTLREELVESGRALGYSQAVAETHRQKAETSSAEFSELNNMLLRVSEPALFFGMNLGYTRSSTGIRLQNLAVSHRGSGSE